MSDVHMRVGNLNPPLHATLKDGLGNPIDLTGTTVKFSMRYLNSPDLPLAVDRGSVVIIQSSPTVDKGKVRYDWQTGDTDFVGSHIGYFTVIDDSDNKEFAAPAGNDIVVMIRGD